MVSQEEITQDFGITQPSSALTTVEESVRSSLLSKGRYLFAAGFGVAVAISCLFLAISTSAFWGIKMFFWPENG